VPNVSAVAIAVARTTKIEMSRFNMPSIAAGTTGRSLVEEWPHLHPPFVGSPQVHSFKGWTGVPRSRR
jgi:hypothetical protein